MIENVSINSIAVDRSLQARVGNDPETVEQYAEAMQEGADFPPIVLYVEGDRHWLSQGFHRYDAAMQAERQTILAEIREGTRADALWDSITSNLDFDRTGRRRTNADKRKAVEMALAARPELSDRELSRQIGVSNNFVSTIRSASVIEGQMKPRKVTRGGQTYEMDMKNIGKSKQDAQSAMQDAQGTEEKTPDAALKDTSGSQGDTGVPETKVAETKVAESSTPSLNAWSHKIWGRLKTADKAVEEAKKAVEEAEKARNLIVEERNQKLREYFEMQEFQDYKSAEVFTEKWRTFFHMGVKECNTLFDPQMQALLKTADGVPP